MSVVNIIIPGAPKAGTMSITSILNQHQDIYVPAWKEPRFFIEDKIRELEDNKEQASHKNAQKSI